MSPSADRPRGGDSGRRRKRARALRRLVVLTGFVVLVGAGAALVLVYGQGLFQQSGEASEPGRTVQVDIPEGVNAAGIGELLEREGVVESASRFVDQATEAGVATKLRPGRYQLRQGEDLDRLLAQLQAGGELLQVRVTLPEGLSIDQAAERLTRQDRLDGAQYAQLAGSPEQFTLPSVGGTAPDVKSLEGLLFPDTYFLRPGEGAATLIRAQLTTFEQQTRELRWDKAQEHGLSPLQVVIVASLIEKEARVPEERGLVAAVIYNRLKKGMRLEIDATTRYALKKWTGALTKRDLETDSPYNTRRSKGLPPGPIASPGLAALEAALEPEAVDYLYYVLEDAEGHHFFTASYEEFLQAKERAPGQ